MSIATIGILGGGQLARMMALSAHPLALSPVVLEPAQDACAAIAAQHICAAYDDPAALDRLCSSCDVITWEFENVPDSAARYLSSRMPVYPKPEALSVSQDRLSEKTMFRELGIPVPEFVAVTSLEDLYTAAAKTGLPAVLKHRRLGYDGKGQAVLRTVDDIESVWNILGSAPCILEAFVPFKREVSVIAVRSARGQTAFYPLSENIHREGILRISRCTHNDPLQSAAESYIQKILDRLEYIGVLALELFDTGSALVANEIAPRVHNSGHWTIEGAYTSQFENHIRAVAGLPLGSTAARGEAAMLNCIGTMPDRSAVLAVPGAHYHDYGKTARAGRKVGHVTLIGERGSSLREGIETITKLLDRA